MMEGFKRFRRMIGLGAALTGSPEAFAAPVPHETVADISVTSGQQEHAEHVKTIEHGPGSAKWASEMLDACEAKLKGAKDADDAREILKDMYLSFDSGFYHYDAHSVKKVFDFRTPEEFSKFSAQLDRMLAIFQKVDLQFGLRFHESSLVDYIERMREFAEETADPSKRGELMGAKRAKWDAHLERTFLHGRSHEHEILEAWLDEKLL